MRVTVEIQPNVTTQEGFAPVDLMKDNGYRLCQLDIQYSKLAPLRQSNPRATDFLLLAGAIYSLDKLILRTEAGDAWTRDFTLILPVSDVNLWETVKSDLNSCLSFLTGDNWEIDFVEQGATPIRPVFRRRRRRLISPLPGEIVCLFSGGLDSLIGAIEWLEQHRQRRILLVGHHDGKMPGPQSDQKALINHLVPAYPFRISSILARIGHTNESVEETEITLRARSLIFIALGIFVASALGPSIPLLIPENGTIALNVPLNPSRRGSCSTRTAHPYYLDMLHDILVRLGLPNPISNPLESKTKGEAVVQCLNPHLLQRVAPLSVSCAKRGHKIHWTHRGAKSCGRCMPCIYRRAALHSAGWDNEFYGDDICQGEVDLRESGEKPNDLRTCLAFLRRNPSAGKISSMLMASGRLEVSRLSSYADMVRRTMEEIRSLLRDKGNREIKRLAGV
jgi:hypothetical protein